MIDIKLDDIKKFDNEYRKNINNKIIENAIKNVGIEKVCLNNDVVNNTYNFFNIELPKSKLYNQSSSSRCWIYAGINLIKNNIADNLNVDEKEYALSINYISFLDKLEKANSLYNRVIENDNFDFGRELDNDYLIYSVYEGGYFSFFKSLINKYGLVPENIMPDVASSKNSDSLLKLYNDKVKKDIFKLIKHKNKSKEELYYEKEKFLKENYNILAKCLGELPFRFDFEYKDKKGSIIKLEGITPLEFSQKYLTMDLNNYVGIANIPMYNKEYGKLYRKKYNENVYKNSYVDFLNLPIDDLKKLAISQLKDKIPVYFCTEVRKMRDYYSGILDSSLYNYRDVFGIELLLKDEALTLHDICFQHLMLITGVHIQDDVPIRWKVEDSYGSDVHRDGYYIMNDNFFNDFVIEVIINKKYLSYEQLSMLNQEPIMMDMNELL